VNLFSVFTHTVRWGHELPETKNGEVFKGTAQNSWYFTLSPFTSGALHVATDVCLSDDRWSETPELHCVVVEVWLFDKHVVEVWLFVIRSYSTTVSDEYVW
jgi:hypothetical protein